MDIVEGYKWARILAENDEDCSVENLECVKKEMSPEQIQKGEDLARQYLSKTAAILKN